MAIAKTVANVVIAPLILIWLLIERIRELSKELPPIIALVGLVSFYFYLLLKIFRHMHMLL